jgi:glycosyltransferase involved in cell wall biosynthesis
VERNQPKIIIILTNNPFPVGLAATNRIISYCKGFLHHSYKPVVLCIRPTESNKDVFNISIEGDYNGIEFAYPGGTTIRDASFWRRRINDTISIIKSLKYFHGLLKSKDTAFVIFYGNSVFTELASIFLTKFFRKRIFKEESENPAIYFARGKTLLTQLQKWFVINKLFRYYNGVLAMTHPLKDYFLNIGMPDKKILVVPQTVDTQRFDNGIREFVLTLPENYIAYVGSLNQQKDGVLSLVNAFSIFNSHYPDFNLIIAGDGTLQEKDELTSLINRLALSEKIHAIGRISSNEIPALFQKAKMLVSCRPKSIQSDYGFPTKVAEYLASGKPVVSTIQGELEFFLKDRVNAFVSNSAEPEVFASKLIEVCEDYHFAIQVGQNGKRLAMHDFNPITQTQQIIEFSKLES